MTGIEFLPKQQEVNRAHSVEASIMEEEMRYLEGEKTFSYSIKIFRATYAYALANPAMITI